MEKERKVRGGEERCGEERKGKGEVKKRKR